METKDGVQAISVKNRKEWRKWLEKHHRSEKAVRLIMYRKHSKTTGVPYADAVEEALCFGWIDGIKHKRDEDSSYQLFKPRSPKSNWSRSNRDRAAKLIAAGLMTKSGQAMIDIARQTGTWEALKDVENEVIPDDLQKLLARNKTANKNFQAFSSSSKKIILGWIISAKRPETRQKRIEQTVALAADNIKANHGF
jgi:uncharacterized protein YdeI (YjbR/CyaY-like superfamily)